MVAAFSLVALRLTVGVVALAVVAVGLYALLSYVRGFLVGTAERPE